VPRIDLARARVILLDIEGTTTPLEFVHRTLFGYARENLQAFLQTSFNQPEVRNCLEGLKQQHANDDREGRAPPSWLAGSPEAEVRSAVEYGLWLIDRDSKTGPLKALQGLIWQQGYQSGKLKGEVYSDVPRAFVRWCQQGKDVSIYSSGSELAQKLLFRTTDWGDLTGYIRAFFDTRIGAKTSAESFRRIASVKGDREDQFFFLSDSLAELEAARSVEMRTALVVRAPANAAPANGHPIVHSFDELS
jgi:enolase-phosphatase E1